jgi:hypothetical protein
MKLRRKLAAVLAATMVVTSVPVVTMAAQVGVLQDIAVVEGSTVGYDEASFTTASGILAAANKEVSLTNETALKVEFDESEIGNTATFYLELDNADFNKEAFITKGIATAQKGYFTSDGNLVAYNDGTSDVAQTTGEAKFTIERSGAKATLTYLSDSEVKVDLDLTGAAATVESIQLPILMEVDSGTPTVKIDGTGTFVKNATIALTDAEVSDKLLSASFDSEVINVEGTGEIGKITLTEAVKGVLNSDDADLRTVTIKLPHSSDVDFVSATGITFKGGRGLAGTTINATVTLQDDDKELLVVFDKTNVTDSLGYVEIEGIKVQSENTREDLSEGEISVTVEGEGLDDTTGVVAEVKDYGVTFKADEVVTLQAGKEEEEVTVVVEELAASTLNNRDDIYFEVDDDAEIIAGSVKVVQDSDNADVTVKEELDDDGKVEGFTVDLTNIDQDDENRIEIKFEVKADLDKTGEINITAESRSFDEDMSIKIADVVAPVTVEVEAATVKVGLKEQEGGVLTIKELEAGMLEDGGQIVLQFDENGIEFDNDDLVIETTSTLKVEVDDVDGDTVILKVTKPSKEAATLTISGFSLNVDRTVPEGSVDLEIGGSALADANTTAKPMEQTITVEDFIKVGTKNTEEVNEAGQAVEAGFKIGATTYYVNGEQKMMDAAPYVSKKNRTMMPVRYVAEAIGITSNNIMYSKDNGGTVTIIAGNRVIQLVKDSNKAIMNGVTIAMDEAVTIKDGRTYIPVGEIARLLGMNVAWDNASKTATFKN